MQASGGLPDVRKIGVGAPFAWLAGGWKDLLRAPFPCLTYGLAMAALSILLVYALVASNMAFWVWALLCGFVFVAPMLAMGMYEAGRRIECGEAPRLKDVGFVRSAFRQDLAYLGVALLFIFLIWGSFAQIVYGLSTHRLHKTLLEFAEFALKTQEGHTMMIGGSIVGAIIAFFAYSLVVVSAPMLLDSEANVFIATVTSFRAVIRNAPVMILWAAILAVLTLATALSGFIAMIVVFPWLGLASWRAYRALVVAP